MMLWPVLLFRCHLCSVLSFEDVKTCMYVHSVPKLVIPHEETVL